MQDIAWQIWDKDAAGSEVYYERAVGKLGEMESSKALCRTIEPFYKPGMKVLDVGCAAGHYLRSLKERVDPNVDYFGVDPTSNSIALAKKVFGEALFELGDIYALSFEDDSFDIVMCNNVLLYLPPGLNKPFEELIRVSKKYIIIRTIFSERCCIIKECNSECVADEQKFLSSENTKGSYTYFNMYSERYIHDMVRALGKNIKISIKPDIYWKEFDNRDHSDLSVATRVIDGRQLRGNIIQDWRFIILEKN